MKANPADKVQHWEIEKLIPYARNSRTHSDEQVSQIAASMREWGVTSAVLVDEEGSIIAGHGRVMAAKKLGMTTLPVMVASGWTDSQKRAFVIADNKLALNAGWDTEMLALEVAELEDLGFDLSLTGFSDEELASIEPEKIEAGLTDEDDVPEVLEQAVTKLGDIWMLENHRVMCGDSTDTGSVALLINGEKADMVFTDPPYNIASHGRNHAKQILSGQSYRQLSESKWDKNFDINLCFPSLENVLATDATCYVATSHFLLPDILQWMSNFFDYNNVCVWSKPNPMPSLSKRHYTWGHEFVAYGTKGNYTFNFPQQGHAHSVWEIQKSSKNDLHPTMKPVAVPEHAMQHSSKQTDIVADLFLGAGSTLIAAEKLNRKCYGMELDPRYCDVIVKRWQDFTGKKAVLESNGKTFDEVVNG